MSISSGEDDATCTSRLRILRKNAGLTLQELAQVIGYSASHLSNVERGEKRPAEGLVQCYESLARGVGQPGKRHSAESPRPVSGTIGVERDDDFGTRLMRLRIASGRSLVQAAERIHISRSHLGNLETGRKRPTVEVARACDEVFDANGALVRLALQSRAQSPADVSAQPAPTSGAVGSCPSMDPDEVLATCTKSLRGLRAVGQREHPQVLLPELVREADHVAAVARIAAGVVQDELWMLAARYAEFAGWMFQELGAQSAGEQCTQTATDWAGLAGDRDMASYAWERRALTALYDGDAETTVALARRAGDCRDVSSRVLGLAARREAQGHALAGDCDAYERALDRSRDLLVRGPAPYPGGVSWGPNTIADASLVIEASCLLDLRRFAEAAELFDAESRRPLRAVPLRTRARFAVKQSMALLGSGETDRACELLDDVLPSIARVDSATIRRDVRRLLNAFNRRRSHPRAASVLPNLHNVLRPR